MGWSEFMPVGGKDIRNKDGVSPITLRKSIASKAVLESVRGDSFQKPLSGKNLLSISDGTADVNGITMVRTDGKCSYSGTTTGAVSRSWGSAILSAGDYVFSCNKLPDKDATFRILKDTTWEVIATLSSGSSKLYTTFTLKEDMRAVCTLGIDKVGVTVSGSDVTLMVEKGTVATEYEKYCGCTASPNPDYPQEIESVDNVTIKAQNKNLFDESKSINGFVNSSLVQSSVATYKISELYPIGEHVVSWGSSTAQYLYIIYYNASKQIIKRSVVTMSGKSSVQVTQETGASYFAVMYMNGGEDGASFVYDIQIERGSTATNYVPHAEHEITIPLSEPLRAINDVKDEICVQDGLYGVLRRIAEVVLNGSETWVANGSAQGYATVISEVGGNPYSNTLSNVLCDKLIAAAHSTVNRGEKNNVIATLGDVHRIYIRFDETITSVALLQAKLAENPITVQYELATPVFEPFEDQTPFYDLPSYDGVTYYSIEGVSDNLSPELNVFYAGSEDGLEVMNVVEARGEAVGTTRAIALIPCANKTTKNSLGCTSTTSYLNKNVKKMSFTLENKIGSAYIYVYGSDELVEVSAATQLKSETLSGFGTKNLEVSLLDDTGIPYPYVYVYTNTTSTSGNDVQTVLSNIVLE